MDDQQRARELLAQEWRKLSEDAPADMLVAGCELPPLVAASIAAITAALRAALEARPLDEWHEDYGPAVWWSLDSETREWLGEPAWIGSPDDSDWPGYHTHWTPHPAMPAARPQGVKG